MYSKTIICLANSRKPPSGRCIAGKVFENDKVNEWIRPTSIRPGHEVSEEERRYESGTKAQLLDIVTIPLVIASPSNHQVENHTLDDQNYWTKCGVATWDQVKSAVDHYDPRFWSNSQSSYHGINDKVAAANVANAGSSLKLILVSDLEIQVSSEAGFEGNPARRRVRANFKFQELSYRLAVTDPGTEEKFLTRGNGEYPIGVAALCVSLAEIWNGFAFRVVASVITQDICNT